MSFDPEIRGLVFSPDSKFFAVTFNDGMGGTTSSVRIWNIAADQEKASLKASSSAAAGIAAIAFAPDGQSIFSTEHAGLVRWDWQSGKRLQVYPDAGGPIAFFPDGKTMAVQGWIGSVRLLDIETGKDLCTLPRAGKHVAFDSHDQRVAWCEGSQIVLAEMPTGKEVCRWQAHVRFAGLLAFAPNGKLLASAGTDYRTRLWELPAGKEIYNLGEDGGQHGLHFSGDGRRLATQGLNRTHVWDVASGKQTAWWPGGEPAAIAANLSVAAVPNHQAQTIRLIDPATGKTRHTLSGYRRDVDSGLTIQLWFAPLFSPDGRLVLAPGAAAGQQRAIELWLWDVASGKRMPAVVSLKTVRPDNLAFSPDGRLLAALRTDGKISLLSTTTAETVRLLGISEYPWHAPPAFTPDGRILISADKGRLRFWEIATGGEIASRLAHQSHVRELVVCADSRAAASVSLDHTTLILDLTRLVTEVGSPAPTGAELDTVWKDLAHPDAKKGRRAIETLIAAPEQAVPLLRERLRPAQLPDAKKLAAWIADLGSDDFERRQQAEQELDRLDEAAGPALQKAVAAKVPLEARRRIEGLLKKLNSADLSAETLRSVRAVQVLETIGSKEAQAILQALADGAVGSRLTQDANTSLERLGKRAATP
jgi:WD40 repeat protein